MGEQQEPAVPPAAESEPPKAPIMIPKSRFDQALSKADTLEKSNAALEAEKAKLVAELAALRGRVAPEGGTPAPAETPPKPATPASPPAAKPSANSDIIELRLDHGYSREAAEAVYGYMQKGLSREEAEDYAKKKMPQVFGQDRRGFDPATHSMAAPDGTAPVQPPKQELNPSQKIAAERGKTMTLRAAGAAGLARARDLIKEKIPK